jgi:hypothetical protein
MKALSKYFASAAAATALMVGAAAPAQAQSWDRRDRGVDTGDIITGVAVLGGIAAIAAALGRDRSRYGTYGGAYGSGYGNVGYGYQNDYRNAVNACAYQAQRYGQGRVAVTDVDRRGANRYRVSGVIQADYGRGGYGYDRNDRYGRYDGYGRNDRYAYARQVRFDCTARADGRVTDFDIDRI